MVPTNYRLKKFYSQHPGRRKLYNLQAAVNLLTGAGYDVHDALGQVMRGSSSGLSGEDVRTDPALAPAALDAQEQLRQLRG